MTKGSEFRRCQTQGRRYYSGHYILVRAENDPHQRRLGIVVTRKTGGAVVRNRWRRIVRECFRLEQNQLPEGGDHVVIVKNTVHGKPDSTARGELSRLFQKVRP